LRTRHSQAWENQSFAWKLSVKTKTFPDC